MYFHPNSSFSSSFRRFQSILMNVRQFTATRRKQRRMQSYSALKKAVLGETLPLLPPVMRKDNETTIDR